LHLQSRDRAVVRFGVLIVASAVIVTAQTQSDLREAARLDQAGRCDEAEKIYQRALAQGEPGPALLNNTGNHYLACGSRDKARPYFERLIRIQPLHLNANVQLARMALSAGEYSRAEDMLQKLAARRPAEFDVLLLLGRASSRLGHLQRARETLETALRLRPDDVEAMVECGLANAASGDFPRGVFLLARAQSKAPANPAIALALARASEDAGYYGDAVLAYDRYLALRSQDRTARRDRARVLALTVNGREEGARQLEQYTRDNPGDALAHFYLAQVQWAEDAEAALASLDRAVRADPKLVPVRVARAWLLHRMGRDSEALPDLEAALRESPDDVRALDQTGLVLLSLNRGAEAETALRKAAALAPRDAEVALHLGRVLSDSGKEEEGRRWLDKWQQLRPARKRDARREPGMIELAQLDPAARRAREIERFRSMARARPDDAVLQLHLAELLLADGQSADALREFETLSALNVDASVWARAGKILLRAGHHGVSIPFLERGGSHQELAEALLAAKGPAAALSALENVPPDVRSAEYKILRARALDAAGQTRESQQWLIDGLNSGALPSAVARQAGLLLAKQGRYREALETLEKATQSAPADRDLRLTEAIVLWLSGETTAAEERLRRIESGWPEWERAWIAHGVALAEQRKPRESAAKFRTAAALGSEEDASACVSIRAWVFGTCGK
jgi:tetratricopeptide (TPR) repeat protein